MLFISHKTEDKAAADEVRLRALQRGYTEKQIFLDSDPGSGIEAGAAWERSIYESLKHTRAMIVICSPNWLKSQWCFVELGYAKAMAISMFPIIVEPCELSSTLSGTQAVDLTKATDATARGTAFERLWTALDARHLGPKDNLPWPPPGQTDNCPFPGLMFFDEKHAPVYFGREQERASVIRQLQKMRASGVPRLLMIVGGSGSGKSSLLRAGVLPWLKHPTEQRDWLVLPTLRYGEAPNQDVTPLARLAEVIAESYPPKHAQCPDWKELRDKFASDDVERATRDFVDATVDLCQARRSTVTTIDLPMNSAPTLVLAIDQFEELLNAAAGPSAQKFLHFLKLLLSRSNGRLLVIGTMRSDFLDTYEQHLESLKPPFLELYRLPPFPWERVTDVITKPAERVDATFTDDLVTRLKADAPNSDALPLLAFTLEKLFRECGTDKLIELREYEQLGGMSGAITQAVTRILPHDLPKETELALRRSFVNHLAQVNEKDEFGRRRADWDSLPDAAKPLLEKFVRHERLLQRSGNTGEFLEVTHEALFRCWDPLKKWLADSLPALRLRRRVEALADEWQRSRNSANPFGDEGLLLTLGQLEAMNEWLPQDEVVLTSGQADFVEVSREKRKSDEQREMGRLKQLADTQAARAEEAIAATKAQRRLTLRAWSAAGIAIVLFGLAIWQWSVVRQEQSVAEYNLYLNRIHLAFEHWRRNELSLANRILDECSNESRNWEWSYLKRLIRHHDWHSDEAAGPAAFASNTNLLAYGHRDNSVRIMDTASRGELQRLALDHPLQCIAFRSDGRWLATADRSNQVTIWDITSGKPLRKLNVGNMITSMAFRTASDELAISGRSGVSFEDDTMHVQGFLWMWDSSVEGSVADLTSKNHIRQFSGAISGVAPVAISPDGNKLVSGTSDGGAALWDRVSGEQLIQIPREGFGATAAAFSPRGDRFVVASDNTIAFHDVDNGNRRHAFTLDSREIANVAYSHDGKMLAVADGENPVRVFDPESGNERFLIRHERPTVLSFAPDDSTMAVVGSFNVVLHYLEQPQEFAQFDISKVDETKGAKIDGLSFAPDGKSLAVASVGGVVCVLNARNAIRDRRLNGPHYCKVLYLSNGALITAGGALSGAGQLRTFDASGRDLDTFQSHSAMISSLALSGDERWLATGSWDGHVNLWEVKAHADRVSLVETHSIPLAQMPDKIMQRISCVWLDYAGQRLYAKTWDGTIQICDQRGREIRRINRLQGGESRFCVSGDGTRIASGTREGIDIFHAATASKVVTIAYREKIWDLCFAPDGSRLATVGGDGTLRIWDAKRGDNLLTLDCGLHRQQRASVTKVAFSNDGNAIAVGRIDGRVLVFDATELEHP